MKNKRFKSSQSFKEKFSRRSIFERWGKLFIRLKKDNIYRKPDFWFRTVVFLYVALKIHQISGYYAEKGLYIDRTEAKERKLYLPVYNSDSEKKTIAQEYINQIKKS